MNDNTLLISYKTLTQSSEVPENVSTLIILPLIKEVQEIEIQGVTGYALFEKIKNDIANNAISGDYKTLLESYIMPVLINGILTDLPFKLNYRFTNIGVVTRTSENAATPEYKDLQKLSDFYRAKRVWHSSKLTDYLISNSELFPEYSEGNGCGQTPKKETFDPGIYL